MYYYEYQTIESKHDKMRYMAELATQDNDIDTERIHSW